MKVLKKSILSLLMVTAMFLSSLSIGFASSKPVIARAANGQEAKWIKDCLFGTDAYGNIMYNQGGCGIRVNYIKDYIIENNIVVLFLRMIQIKKK